MTLIDALTRLRDYLPEDPALDDDHQAAVRVVVEAMVDRVRDLVRDARGFPLRHIPAVDAE